ncbi:MAG: putative Ig domain-containing protein [Acidobacteriota bacterium]|nr:putative Ig domain-containing protein [Acidobacteriota bacterium]
MTGRRALLLALLLAAASIGAWAQPGPFTITPTSLPVGGGMFTLGQAISTQQLGPNPQLDQAFSWAVSSGTFPPGLNLDPAAATITGTPTQAGAFTFTILAQEIGTNYAAFQQYTVYVSLGPALSLSPLTHPQAAVGVAYTSSTFQAAGGVPGYTWGLQNGTNADGLSINAGTGQLTGTPTAGGVFPMVVVLTDASGASVNATFTLNVLGVSTTTLPGTTVGSAYSQTLAAMGGTGTLTWSVQGTNLPPPGLTLSSLGQITGTPTASGTFLFVVKVTDSATQLSTLQGLSITVASAAAITPATLSNGTVNVPYTSTTLTVPGVVISNWAVTLGTLPTGLSLNASTGVVSGTPSAAGSFPFAIVATPAGSTAVVQPPVRGAFTMVINAAPSVTINVPPTGVAATQPNATVTLSGTYPLDITGTMTLSFAPLSGIPQNSYDAKFAAGGTTAQFTIPAGSTSANVPVIIGTVAGTITIATTTSLSSTPIVSTIPVNPTVPVITGVTPGAAASGGFSISVTGRSTPRNMTSAVFHFTSPTGTTLASADITVPLTSAFTTWYGSSTSIPFGSTFSMTVHFSFTAPVGETIPYTTVTVTLTNSVGASNTSAPFSP